MRKISVLAIFFAFISSFTIAAEVNVFSARHYDSDIQLYKKFTAKMSDSEWFSRWRNHDKDAQLWPGDGILADIKIIKSAISNKYDDYIKHYQGAEINEFEDSLRYFHLKLKM